MSIHAAHIAWARAQGAAVVEPFVPGCLGPNSYDLHLGPWLYEVQPSSHPGEDYNTRDFAVAPADRLSARVPGGRWLRCDGAGGYALQPGCFYLAATVERAGTTRDLVPHIDGRSSVGRMGVRVHATAGRGDVGFVGHWTLEVDVAGAVPVKVYAGMRVAQMAFYAMGPGATPDLFALNAPEGAVNEALRAQGLPDLSTLAQRRYGGRYAADLVRLPARADTPEVPPFPYPFPVPSQYRFDPAAVPAVIRAEIERIAALDPRTIPLPGAAEGPSSVSHLSPDAR